MDASVKVSIIMPVYNSGSYLLPAVNSVLMQEFNSFELILVDDGSSDGSSDLCDELASKDNRVVVIHQKNGGICHSRNAALDVARGEYVMFIDHDDEYCEGVIKTAVERAEKIGADLVKYSNRHEIISDGKEIRHYDNILIDDIVSPDQYLEKIPKLINSWALDCVWDALFRVDVIRQFNIKFDESFKHGGEDIAFCINYLQHCKRIVTIKDIYYRHFVRVGFSTSSKQYADTIENVTRLTRIVVNGLDKIGINYQYCHDWLIFYLTRSYLCIAIASFLSISPKVKRSFVKQKLAALLSEDFMPSPFFSARSISIYRYSPKIGLAYFFMKHSLYYALIYLFKLRSLISSFYVK